MGVFSVFIFSHLKGLHLNLALVTNLGFTHLLSILLGRYFPGLFGFHEEDVRRMFPFLKKGLYKMLEESGYSHIQATRPDTVGKEINKNTYLILAVMSWKQNTLLKYAEDECFSQKWK